MADRELLGQLRRTHPRRIGRHCARTEGPDRQPAVLRDALGERGRLLLAHRRLRRARSATIYDRSGVPARTRARLQRPATQFARGSRAGPRAANASSSTPQPSQLVRSRRAYWNPFTFVDPRRAIEDPEQAAAAMRATVRSCTQALSAGHASLLHRLSGGLDSSIVAGCLGRPSTQPRIACYTYFNPDGRSDERQWARLAAEHAGFEHLECPIAPADVPLADLTRPRPATEPLPLLAYLLRSTVEHRLAAQRNATAVFTGDGGDSGFCSDSFPYAVTDYLRRHGPGPAALRLASEVALRTERSTWAVLLTSIRRWLFGAKMSEQLPALLMGSRLVSAQLRDAYAIPESYPHPWFAELRRVPWDLIRRLGMLVSTPEFYNVADAAQPEPEIVSPLYAQPAGRAVPAYPDPCARRRWS